MLTAASASATTAVSAATGSAGCLPRPTAPLGNTPTTATAATTVPRLTATRLAMTMTRPPSGGSPAGAAALDGHAPGHVLQRYGIGDLPHEDGHGVVVGPDALDVRTDPGLSEQDLDVATLLGKDERDDAPGGPGAGGAPGAVQVGLVLGGRVDVDDELDA